jgi:hypothetical protein
MVEKLAKWLYKKLPDKVIYDDSVRQDLQTLEPAADILKIQKEYIVKKLSICIIVVFLGVNMSITLWITENIDIKIVDNILQRNEYGDGAKTVELVADDGEGRYDIAVELNERLYTDSELLSLSDEAITLLDKEMLGQNESADKVEYDIRLVKSIEGYPFEVEWSVDEEYIDCNGKLVNNQLQTPHMTELTAVLSCESFRLEHTVNLMVYSKAVQPDMQELIQDKLHKSESESRQDKDIVLPDEISGKSLSWSYKKSCTGLLFLIATPILVFVLYYSKDRDLHKQVLEREEQMMADYPEIVSSLALLIGAGMTVPNAWNKIARDYKTRKEETGRIRYAYEEMLFTIYEMESGVVQTTAYERFGRRCRLPRYNKLVAMLSQNIRKGAVNLPLILKEEAGDAFEDRKHSARKQGEKAGTKLLVPMMLLLGVTMVIIMVPAFKTYF